jgi:hypothetical protein
MTYIHTKLHMPNGNISLVIAIKQKAKHRFHIANILSSYSLHIKKKTWLKLRVFQKSVIIRNARILIPFPRHKFLCSSCAYYWLWEIKKYDFEVASNGTEPSIPNFINIRPAVLKLKHTE